MGRRPARTRDEVIHAALELVERDGLDALSLRELGAALGTGHTGVYTHFEDKQGLVDALVTRAAGGIEPSVIAETAGARSRLCDLAMRARAAFARHPRLAPALLQASGQVDATHELSRAILVELIRAGLDGRRLLVAFRALENYVVGVSIFDYGGAPQHLATRAGRQRAIDPTVFETVATEADVAALNEEAFMAGFERLLDGFGVHDD